jgi:glyoxylate/hydroxypyruvate reductase A
VSTLHVYAGDDGAQWRTLFAAQAPEIACVAWPEAIDPSAVSWIACWNPPDGFFAGFPNLRTVFALGAGVERLIARADLPPQVDLVRLVDAGMAAQMVEYAQLGVLLWQRRCFDYRAQQAQSVWHKLAPIARADTRVGVLGLGAMGAAVASALEESGYRVWGWSRRAHHIDRVRCLHDASGLAELLGETDVLVNTLPSTAATRGLLDRTRLALLPAGALVVNAARGDQLDAAALLQLLDAGHLGGALLDVFDPEPLAADSPLWRHPRIVITPHVAATTLPDPAVAQIVDNLRRLRSGEPLSGMVDRRAGY